MGNETVEKTERKTDKKMDTCKPSTSNVNMTDSQFKELLTTVMSSMQSGPDKKKGKTFTSCTSRFSGSKQSSLLEAFLAAVNIFKEVEGMEDHSALAAVPLLLIEEAGTWWQGIKEEVKTWDNFTDRLRSAFAPKKPAYKIYQDIVEIKQDSNTPLEIFVAEKRALIAQLPKPAPSEEHQIDLVFGQIRFEIREKISRDEVRDFSDLLRKAKDVENNLAEKQRGPREPEIPKQLTLKEERRCNFCRLRGHTMISCRKRIRQEQASSQKVSKDAAEKTEHLASTDSKPKFSCYGCGEPGVVRSRCPKCAVNRKVAVESVSFCSLRTSETDVRPRPIIPVKIANENGKAYIDTCAKSSVASFKLYMCLKEKGYAFKEEQMFITLADGIPKRQRVLTVKAPVEVFGRAIPTSFIIFPEARENRTLLGVGFIQDAMIILNLPQMTFTFLDQPERMYELENEVPDMTSVVAGLLSDVTVPNMISPLSSSPELKSPDMPESSRKRSLLETPNDIIDDEPCGSLTSEKAMIPISDFFMSGVKKQSSIREDSSSEKPYGPVLPIEFASPPIKKQIMLFDGHSPVITQLYDDARRSLNEQEVNLSPHSASLFPSPKINIGSLEVTPMSGLTEEERGRLEQLLSVNESVFVSNMKPTTRTEHVIDTGKHSPISVPPYRLSPARIQVLKDEVKEMLKEKVIEPCVSPWSAPVVMVPKKDGKIRVCVDYRQLNSVTTPDVYPLPRIDDLLNNAKPTPYMTTIDLRAGYWQIKVREEDQTKTTFITPFGMYKFLRMPFGLRNAPATFQRLMDQFRISLSHIKLLVYLDDLICLSSTFEEHIKDLQEVFNRLKEYNLTANKEKCKFCCPNIKYLGHYITPKGLSTDPDKVSSITSMAIPRNVKHLLSFLQMCSWYRRFIANFAEVAEPLTRLTRKKVLWQWKDEQQSAFEKLKTLLTNSPILVQADDSKPYIIKTDASGYAIGAVLVQGEGLDEHPVEYASRLLISAERNYSTTEREALAVVWAVNKFRGYIEGTPITVLTDHQALRWLMTLKSPSGRLARWALQLQSYDITIKYITGRTNVVADSLSRPNCDPSTESECGVCSIIIDLPRKSVKEIREEQMKDEVIQKIVKSLEENRKDEEALYWTRKGYLMNNGLLYRYNPSSDSENAQIVVPKHEHEKVMYAYHDQATAGHYGVDKTFERISNRYYWKGMRTDIEEYIRNCIKCQRYKPSNLKPAGLLQTTVINQRFEVIAFDLFGPLPKTATNKSWIFIIEDVTTRWVELFALEHATAEECARLLIDEIFLRYGTPRRLISDNGSQFVSSVMQQLVYCMKIHHGFTPVYHPETNPVERKNRDLKTQLGILVEDDHTTWADKLPCIRFAMNTAVSAATKYTAAYLTFGRELRTPDDVNHDMREIVLNENFIPEITPKLLLIAETLKRSREISEMKEEKRKEYVDQKRLKCPNYSTGDTVMVDSHLLSKSSQGFSAKLAPRRDGPYVILRSHGPSSFQIADPSAPNTPVGLYHASALRPYRGPAGTPLPEPAQPIRRRGRPRKAVSAPAPHATKPRRPVGRPTTQSDTTTVLSSSSGRSRRQRGRL